MSCADDTKLYLSHKNPQILEDGINRDLANTIQWFQQNGTASNPDKYQALVLENTVHNLKINSAEKPGPFSSEIRLIGLTKSHNIMALGLTLDKCKLQFDSHIASICGKVARQVAGS